MCRNFKLFHWISNLLVLGIVAAAVILVGMRLLGVRTFTVLSGSMEPDISTGSLIYVHPVDYQTLKTGDVITFQQGEKITVTHRIVSVYEKDGDVWFQTKGDANSAADGNPVHWSNIIGCPFFSIPAGGYIVHYLKSPPVWYTAAALGALGMLFLLFPDVIPKKYAKTRKGKYLRQ